MLIGYIKSNRIFLNAPQKPHTMGSVDIRPAYAGCSLIQAQGASLNMQAHINYDIAQHFAQSDCLLSPPFTYSGLMTQWWFPQWRVQQVTNRKPPSSILIKGFFEDS